ncbi:MAG: hypothetical protein ABIF85_00880 [Nanoarchaeota archaeon]|nr:hypothetical protein [Nanoarchaeota archaeon]MBU4300481.1 hypothetical protein [Nanoarchaeota archaeon]MBU4451961.1 hypothetical protein [Nanoarchaeota archaeon]MCG2724120.1 hypothetical protein [archaeon]
MRSDPKHMELVLIAAIITVTIVTFVLILAGTLSNTPQTTLINVSLLMIFGGLLLLSIISLQIYDKLIEINETLKTRHK